MSDVEAIHRMIEYLIRNADARAKVKSDLPALFSQFSIPDLQREILQNGSRDELHSLKIHPNYIIKWLIWSGRPTMPFFPLSYYFDRR